MAIPWSQVESKPEFQALSTEDKIAAQEQYFNQVVAPQVGDQVDAARNQFFGQYDYSQPEVDATAQEPTLTETPELSSYVTGQKQQPQFSYQTRPEQGMRQVEGFTPEIGDAPELNELSKRAFMTSLGLLTTGDPEKQQAVIKSQIPEAEFGTNEKGEAVVSLPSGEYRVGGPMQDLAAFTGQALAYTPAGRAASLPAAAASAGLTEFGLQGLTQAAGGGDVSVEDVALSTALGAGGKFAERAIQGLGRAAMGQASPEQVAVREFAQQQGAPLMTTDVVPPQTFAGKSAQALGEKIPVTGTGQQRAAQQESRSKVIEEFSQRFGEYNPQEVVDSLQRQKSKVKNAAGNMRNRVVDQVGDSQLATNNTIDAIDSEIERLTRSPGGVERKTADMATVQKLQDYKDDILADPTFSNLEQLRTNFRTDVKGERMVMPDRSQASINKIYSGMTKDMDEVVKQNMTPQEFNQWKKSNAVFAEEANKIKNTRLKNVLQKGDLTPEAVNTMLYSNKPSEVKTLYNSLDQRGKRQARAGLIAKAIDQSGESPDRFLNNLNKMSKQTGITFKGEDKKYLDGLKAYLDATRRAGQAGVQTPTGQELFQVAVPAGVAGDVATTGGLGTLGGLGYGLVSRAYESAPIRDLMIKLSGVNPRTQAFDEYVAALSSQLRAFAQANRATGDQRQPESQ